MTKPLPSVEYLRECFRYHPENGVLRWLVRPRNHFGRERDCNAWNSRYAWSEAGFIGENSYLYVAVDDCHYRAHRIIWKFVIGEDPPETIDHIDGNRTNNRIDNLRPATQKEQTRNTGLRNNNTSGFRGVVRHREKWQVKFMIDGVRHHQGSFDTPEEAFAVYEAAVREIYGEFYRSMDEA